MGEEYHNELKAKLCEGNISKVIVQQVLKTNYHKMNFKEFEKEFDDLMRFYVNLESSFLYLWAAGVAYAANNGIYKSLLLPQGNGTHNGYSLVDYTSLTIMKCGALFREFPRVAYLKKPPLQSDKEITNFFLFFGKPENKKFLDFWRKVDNSDAPACPDDTTDTLKLTKELKAKCQEIDKQIDNLKQIKEDVLEIQEKLQQSAI